MRDRLYSVRLEELNGNGERTGRVMNTVLSSEQIDSELLERLFVLINPPEQKQ